MPAFRYLAVDRTGHEKKGVLEADSERQIRQQLRERGLFPIDVLLVSAKKENQASFFNSFHFQRKQKIKISDLALLTRQFASLLSAGMPIEEALLGVSEQSERSDVKSILMGVRSFVLEGRSLAQGMDNFPAVFPPLYRETVRAGEKSGELDKVLNRVADYVEKQHRISQKVSHALIYPSLLIIVSIGILVFLLIYIVPKIVDVFSESAQSLPFITRLLLALSAFIQENGVYMLIFILVSIFAIRHVLNKEKYKYQFHLFLTKLPLLGKRLKVINSARFARTFGILFSASVPVLDAMSAASEVISLLPMKKALNQAVVNVGEGTEIHLSLKNTGYFSPMSLNLIALGESTGQLSAMLERSAEQQEHDVTLFIEGALTLFEPLMILVMGGMVLFIVLAVLLPIFNLDALLS